MKFVLPRGQKWFLIIVGAIFLLYQGYHLWTNRDITWHWKEEVQLSDSTRHWIEREIVIGTHGGGEPFTSSRGPKSYRIYIESEEGKLMWEFPQVPLILDRGNAPVSWTVIALPRSCEDERLYGPYIQYEYLKDQWVPRRINEKWQGNQANLLVDRARSYKQPAIQVGKSLTLAQVKEINGRWIGSPNKSLVVVDLKHRSYCYQYR